MKFCAIFVIYLTIYFCTNPLKIRIYTIRWSIPWKHLQVHASPYKYCYLNASKCDCIVIFLTICAWRGGGYFLLAIKTLPLLSGGGTYKLWNFYMPRSNTCRYIPQKLFSNLATERKKERPFLIPLSPSLMNKMLMIQLFHLLL